MKIMKFLLVTMFALILISLASPMVSAEITAIEPMPDITIDEDETALSRINLHDYFSNDSGSIYFPSPSVDNKVEVTIHEDGEVDFSAPQDWFGAEEVTFIASDGVQEISDTIQVTVKPVNDSPTLLKPLPDLAFEEDDAFLGAVNLNAHFLDIDSNLDFSCSSDFINVQINDDGQVDFSAPKDWYGTEEIEFSASDGEFVEKDAIVVTITPVNDAPRGAMGVASISLNAGQHSKTLELKDYFTDVDDDVLNYEVSGNKRINCEINAQKAQLILRVPQDWSGEEFITLTAKDPSGEASSVQILVIAAPGTDSSGQMFYLLGLVLAVAITGARLKTVRKSFKSPVKLESYRHYKDH